MTKDELRRKLDSFVDGCNYTYTDKSTDGLIASTPINLASVSTDDLLDELTRRGREGALTDDI